MAERVFCYKNIFFSFCFSVSLFLFRKYNFQLEGHILVRDQSLLKSEIIFICLFLEEIDNVSGVNKWHVYCVRLGDAGRLFCL